MNNENHSAERQTSGRMSFVSFSVWTFIMIARPQDYWPFLMPFRPVLFISALTLAAMLFKGFRFPEGFLHLREVRLIVWLYIIMIVGIPFAVHKGVAFNFVFTVFPRTLLYFFVFLIQVQSLRRLNTIAWVAVGGAMFSGLNYLGDTLFAGAVGSRVYASQTYDPNDIALMFVTYLPLSVYFVFFGDSKRKRIISIIAALTMAAGIVISQSRGGALALACILLALIFLKTPRLKGGSKVVTVVVLIGISLPFYPALEKRFQNMRDDYNLSDEGGRLNIWKQNLRILRSHPFFGVGANCSTVALGFYRAKQEGLQAWQVTHSSLIQVAVETGIPGLIVFLVLNIGAIANLRRIRKGLDHDLSLLPFFLEICFYGFWASALFLSHGYSINLYFLLAMSASVRWLNENFETDSEG